jgi:hypothetical protein
MPCLKTLGFEAFLAYFGRRLFCTTTFFNQKKLYLQNPKII